jgi:peptidyl-dipeptidase Dcp
MVAAALTSCEKDQNMNNPFFEDWTLPHGAVPFDQIKTEHYKPAILKAIEEEDQEIDAIANNPEAPTFANTVEALEYTGQLLEKVGGVFYNMLECDGTDDMLALAEEMQPIYSQHQLNIALNEKLFERVETVWNEYKAKDFEGLTVAQQRMLKDHYEGYLKAGATLKGEARERWRKVSARLDSLTLAYGQNVQKATGEWSYQLDPEKGDLAGLPDFAADAYKQNGYKLTLLAPSYRPFMTYSSRRDLREMLYKAYNQRCYGGKYDNTQNIQEIAKLRQEKADLLGFQSFADMRLTNTMAKTPESVNNLLNTLLNAYKAAGTSDVKEVAALARKDGIDQLMPWDFSYYSEKLKKEKFNVNDAMVKPFFSLEKVKEGVFGLAKTLYGVTFRKLDVPVYNPDVECFEVIDKDSTYLGLLYTDFFPRETKRPGAWMTEFRGQKRNPVTGADERPIVQIVMSFTKPVGNPGEEGYTPSLLTYDEVETFLHEFGHSLHGLLTKCTYPSQSGTSVAHDFVELPSQFNENFLGKKEFLDTFAADWQTGEKIPQELIDRLHEASAFQAGYLCLRQLSFGMLDMAFHSLGRTEKNADFRVQDFEYKPTERFPQLADIEKFEEQAMLPTQLLPHVEGTMMCTSFTHIFSGGYAAGYYGYKWAEVLDADAFAVFEREGLSNPETAARFRHLLESGDTVDPAELYRQFKGEDPSIEALMKRDGILK